MIARLLCDEMLAGLCRWLRAAGHDAELAASGSGDDALLRQTRDSDRLLLTRDVRLAERGGAQALLMPETLERQAALLRGRLALDWMAAPFTRCLVDNVPLREASPAERERMPANARGLPGPFHTCPACGRLYWPGSHVRRMLARLQTFAAPRL